MVKMNIVCGHLERPHCSKGMCRSCYQKAYSNRRAKGDTKYEERLKEWRRRNQEKKQVPIPERVREMQKGSKVSTVYKITPGVFDHLFKAQGGKCANEGCTYEVGFKDRTSLFVDKDMLGAVRGLLCRSCILTLRLSKEDTKRLSGLTAYLTFHGPVRSIEETIWFVCGCGKMIVAEKDVVGRRIKCLSCGVWVIWLKLL